jgi:CTP:molybdopterin cytidylyltransferase MocA
MKTVNLRKLFGPSCCDPALVDRRELELLREVQGEQRVIFWTGDLPALSKQFVARLLELLKAHGCEAEVPGYTGFEGGSARLDIIQGIDKAGGDSQGFHAVLKPRDPPKKPSPDRQSGKDDLSANKG